MATKKSVFLATPTISWIDITTTKNQASLRKPKWSESINATFEHFRHLLRVSLPDFDQSEWAIILNVYDDSYFPDHSVPARVASDMMEKIGEISLDRLRKSNPEYAALVERIHALTQTQQLAILYFVQIFYARNWQGDTWDEIVDEIIAKI